MDSSRKIRTPAQENAVVSRGRSLMVSAAAGSGKTATLTDRILGLLTDPEKPAELSSMLIVTYTRKAAGELRQRITDALNRALADCPGSRQLQKQLTQVGAAEICTIDAYYLNLVRENFQKLGLSSGFRMADPAESDLLAEQTAGRITERLFAESPEFSHLADTLTSARDTDSLEALLVRFAREAEALPGGTEGLEAIACLWDREAAEDFFESRVGRLCRDRVSALFCRSAADLSVAAELCEGTELAPYLPMLQSDAGFAREAVRLLQSGASYPEVRSHVLAYRFPALGRAKKGADPDLKARVSGIRDSFKKALAPLQNTVFAPDAAALSDALRETAAVNRTLVAALREYTAAFREAKNRRMIADFADVADYARRLLIGRDGSPTELALAQQRKYSYIFVDEYQDTDARQDSIFRAVSRGDNLFLVGDIKQSIYGFRGARPEIFAGYRSLWPPFAAAGEGEPASLFMSENFRCSRAVIDFTNAVCGRLFRRSEAAGETVGIGYRAEDDLICAGKSPSVCPVTVLCAEGVVPADGGAPLPPAEKNGSANEVRVIVQKIREIAARRGNPSAGRYAWQDIAVLARTKPALKRIAAALTAEGIPFCNYDGSDLFANPEVLLFTSVLNAIDNPMRDLHLAGALRSPVFGFTPTDLVRIRSGRRNLTLWEAMTAYAADPDADAALAGRCASAADRLRDYRRLSEEMSVDRFVRLLWRETGAQCYAGSDPVTARQKPVDRQSNLRTLYNLAREYRSSGYVTLHDFVEYLDGRIRGGRPIELPPSPAVGAVSLMTVHKSKGLEFPAVILADTARSFNRSDRQEPNLFTDRQALGLVPKLTDPAGLCAWDTPMHAETARYLSSLSTAEEIRVLYVALTRAREELYLTAAGKPGFLAAEQEAAALHRGLSTDPDAETNWFSWVIRSLYGMDANRPDGFFRLVTVPSPEAGSAAEATESTAASPHAPAAAATGETDVPPDTQTAAAPAAAAGESEPVPERPAAPESNTASPDAAAPAAPAELPPSPDIPAADYAARRERALQKMRAALAYTYPYEAESRIPAKLTVSRLYPDLLTDAEREQSAFPDTETPSRRVPTFLGGEKNGAADRGTATHIFLQFCDFSRLDGTPASARAELERLVALAFLPAATADLVRLDEICRFARSAFFADLKKAVRTERERRFNLLLPAADFTSDPELRTLLRGEELLVQGVIDLFYFTADGRLVLCDYKTDRLPRELMTGPEPVAAEMRRRHGLQLTYYAEAIRRICGRPADRVCVFPLAYGESVDVM